MLNQKSLMEDINKILAISIPTYNRAGILSENLAIIIEECLFNNVPIYIFDDSSNDDTKNIVEIFKKKYSYIFYTKNKNRLGHDLNCIKSLSTPQQDYIWYLGDSMLIYKNSIGRILSIIQSENSDFISFKEKNRRVDISSKNYHRAKNIFVDLAWHLTMTGTTVYRRSSLRFENFDIRKFKNFPQLALIFNSFIDNESKLYWFSESLIYGNLSKKSYWTNNVFEVFFTDLESAYSNFPQNFPQNLIDDSVKSHSIKSKLFGYHSFVKMRINDVLNYKIYCSLKGSFTKYTGINNCLLIILSIFPKRFLKLLYILLRFFVPEKKQIL
ncbi:glycosyltransferase [Chryseobacterium wangxinyae]|uniref:glycosyltransferase family 2 protein n=1 Tax=Chryseobacterium sp. CY350 TaxID=2997336 RepID=UPI00226DB92C|nr:glycosyltransferase [Chryseobacterium sp. CY350]MCY0977112.1 glycosyltransferase [Chryseobacterium sp. CY350]WBZ97109.1 glycosyltransferase [Chryseobacterium sp. CY350]